MAEEKRLPEASPQAQQAPAQAAPQAQQAPAQAAPQATPEAAPAVKEKKNKKVSQMTMKEVEEKLVSVKEKMGRLDSRYAKELLKRKEVLTIR